MDKSFIIYAGIFHLKTKILLKKQAYIGVHDLSASICTKEIKSSAMIIFCSTYFDICLVLNYKFLTITSYLQLQKK